MIQVVVGDLKSQDREALVRPMRSDLAPLTAGARDVLRAAGPAVEERLQQLGSVPIGGAAITPGGGLASSFIIHVVTASEEEPETSMSVQRALRNGLRRAADWGITSLALPPLGMGAGHMEAEEAARVEVEILVDHLGEGKPPLDITIVAGSEYEAGVFRRLVEELMRDQYPVQTEDPR